MIAAVMVIESPEALGSKVWAALGAVKVEQAPGGGVLRV